jgi:hypothetical protein
VHLFLKLFGYLGTIRPLTTSYRYYGSPYIHWLKEAWALVFEPWQRCDL